VKSRKVRCALLSGLDSAATASPLGAISGLTLTWFLPLIGLVAYDLVGIDDLGLLNLSAPWFGKLQNFKPRVRSFLAAGAVSSAAPPVPPSRFLFQLLVEAGHLKTSRPPVKLT
jgi:hypothetical protein